MTISNRAQLVCLCWLSMPGGGWLGAASIGGKVLGEDGKPVQNAVVTAVLESGRGPNAKAVSDAKGEFLFAGLGVGGYRFCVQAPGGRHLDPCLWAPPVATARIKTAADTHSVSVTMESGSELQVQLTDSQGLLEKATPDRRMPDVMVGVFTPAGLFVPARVMGKGAGYRNYAVRIPFEMPVRVSVNSGYLQLKDEQKKSLPVIAPPIQVVHKRKGPAPQAIVLEVAGVRP